MWREEGLMGCDKETPTSNKTMDPLLLDARILGSLWIHNILEAEDIDITRHVVDAFQFCTEGLRDFAKDFFPKIPELLGEYLSGASPSGEEFSLGNSQNLNKIWRKLDNLMDEYPSLKKDVARELSARLQSYAASKGECPGPAYQRARDAFSELFNLDADDFTLIGFIFICRNYRYLRDLLSHELSISEFCGRGRLCAALGMSRSRLNDVVDRLGKLGILRSDRHSVDFQTDDIARLWDLSPGQGLEGLFCSPLQGETLPLSDFPVSQEGTGYILDLLEGAKGGAPTQPIHILLYGPPGTGKSTFARSLAATLGVRAWAVAPKVSKESGMDRRLSLNVSLNRAARQNGALVVVDEAENVLSDRHFLSSGGLSVDKGWINELMEKPGSPVIWIVNYPNVIDPTIKRRFSHSLYFPPLGNGERRKLWERVLLRHGAVPQGDGERLDGLVRAHRLPAAVIDRAVRQARERGGDFWGDVALALKAYEELERGGKRMPKERGAQKGFTLDGVTAGIEARPFIERLKAIDLARGKDPLPAGFGTMLFFGPPGTGKSAMARHLAHELGKELLIKRASDIVDCYVGQTERNIAEVFREAEEEDAILVIDEADTFVYHRDMAIRSWEVSFVNEFLVAVEECCCFLVCTSNRRDKMDPAAMRRFSFKVPFRYAGPRELQALYMSLLAPLVGAPPGEGFLAALSREKNLAPGDFHAVLSRNRLHPGRLLGHQDLLRDLTEERDLKLERDCARIGF
jgi:AAA+ superfamily predicted ATPase